MEQLVSERRYEFVVWRRGQSIAWNSSLVSADTNLPLVEFLFKAIVDSVSRCKA
jgi:hypothetical protein